MATVAADGAGREGVTSKFGIGEAPSLQSHAHGYAHTPSSLPNAMDSYLARYASSHRNGTVADEDAKGVLMGPPSSSPSVTHQSGDIPPATVLQSSSAASPFSKSRSKLPSATIGAGKAAHAHRQHFSIDGSYGGSHSQQMTINDRTRSKTGVTNPSIARAASPASFYAGGIGESPARSRQNSSSSLGSTYLASSMFSHRQTSSTSTQNETMLASKGHKAGPSRLNSASTANTSSIVPQDAAANANNTSLPAIRGYNTFPDIVNISSTRPRTPLLDPFMRYRGGQPGTAAYQPETYTGSEPPRIGRLSDEPGPSNSYVASLATAPLVSRPAQGGQPLYISGGRTPDTLHAAPSSTYSTPNLHSSSSMQFTGSNHTVSKPNAVTPFVAGRSVPRTGIIDSHAGLAVSPNERGGYSRPVMRHRSSSVDSYLPHGGQQARGDEDSEGRTKIHQRQQSGGLAGLTNFFLLRSSNSEDKSPALSRRRSSRDNQNSRSRKGSMSNTVNTGQSGKLSSRFVHYGQPPPDSRPRTPASETRTRQRSSSFGATATQNYQFPGRDSPTHPGIGLAAPPRGRLPRGHNASSSDSAMTASSSLGRRKEEKRARNKLISARLPDTVDHRDARLPSQPLGYTWICGAGSAARTPSFYEEFDYSAFPGGKRKRSMSRSTITQRNYATMGASNFRTGSRAGERRGSEDPAYESEPEFLARRRARDAASNMSRGGTMVDEQTQTLPQEALYASQVEVPHLAFPTGGGALLTDQEEEKALRRRSQSLVNMRRTYSRSIPASVKDEDRKNYNDGNNMVISHPFRESSNQTIRTPRAAPVPFSPDGHRNGYDPSIPPLFMGESRVLPDRSHRRDGAGLPSNLAERSTMPTFSPSSNTVRRAPSRASIEAIDDREKRREALFAVLPPPARRSPTPVNALSPSMYTTGRIDSPPMQRPKTREGVHINGAHQNDRNYLDTGNDISSNVLGAITPPVDDYSQFEASRVIIGQADLMSSAAAPERFPVVYGQAFSTTHESHEGEILNASSSAGSLSAMAHLQAMDSSEQGQSRDSLTPLREVETPMAIQGIQTNSGSGESGSASRSISNGSARILDLNEESFTNLFFKAPPPSKPLPSLPSTDSNDLLEGGSESHFGLTPSPAYVTREDSSEPESQDRPDSLTVSERFPTPDFSVLDTFDIGEGYSQSGDDYAKRDSRRETLTHPFARVTTGRPHSHHTESRGLEGDFANFNLDSNLLGGERQIWPPEDYEEEENEVLLQPPLMARNFTSSTARTVDTFYTAGGGGPSNASASALDAPSLAHQQSFASARSYITANSAGATPQAELSQSASQERGESSDAIPDQDEEHAGVEGPMASIRRTALSPIFVQRPSVSTQSSHGYVSESPVSNARTSGTQPPSTRALDGEATETRRDSFIEFEPVLPVRARAPSDTRSFIDDDSGDEDESPRNTVSHGGMLRAEDTKADWPSVIVEGEEESDRGLDNGLSPTRAVSPYSPFYAATSPSHYSVTPSEIIDTYRNQMHDSSGAISRDSRGAFSLGLPLTPKIGNRSSGGSHTHSVSNVSIMSSLSKLEDFPEPPPSVTPAYQKDEASAMMQRNPSVSTIGQRDVSSSTPRARDSSLPGGPHNQSRATINTQSTQTTSIYTFSSSVGDTGDSGENHGNQQGDGHRNIQAGDSPPPKRLFEFPMRRTSSKRSMVDSFLDTTASPERNSRDSPSSRAFDARLNSSSGATSPNLRGQSKEDRSTPSPSQQSFRSSGFFARRPKHERTSSDPSIVTSAKSLRDGLIMVRSESGGFENQEEKRQSWKRF